MPYVKHPLPRARCGHCDEPPTCLVKTSSGEYVGYFCSPCGDKVITAREQYDAMLNESLSRSSR